MDENGVVEVKRKKKIFVCKKPVVEPGLGW